MIDSHSHLDDKQFDVDREEVILRAFSKGVKKIVNIGAGLGSSERSVALARSYKNIYAVVGLHPHYFMKHGSWGLEHKKKLEKLARADKVVAIGEIGLEYYSYDGKSVTQEQKKFQKEGFLFQLELAQKLNLPVVIHCRGERAQPGRKFREEGKVYEDIWKIMENFPQISFTFHSFAGRLDFARKILQRQNIFFSWNGNITYAKPEAEILEVIKKVPLERIMLETDCPYLAPVPKRGERNEPAYVYYVAQKLAEIKEQDASQIIEKTTQNAQNFFGL